MSEFAQVAAVSDVPVGGTLRVPVGEKWLSLYNVDGEIFATADECSHAVASLAQGCLTGHVIECPRHGATFDVRTGKNLTFPAVAPVKHYEVRVEDGSIWVAV